MYIFYKKYKKITQTKIENKPFYFFRRLILLQSKIKKYIKNRKACERQNTTN